MNKKALIVVDPQNDFISGTLTVPHAEEIIEMINNLTSASTNITYTSAMSKTSIPIMNNTTNDIYADCNLYDFYQILSGTADILSETLILSAEIA